MKINEIVNKDASELQEMLKEYKQKLGKLVFQAKSNTLKKVSDIKMARRDIARIRTMISRQSHAH